MSSSPADRMAPPPLERQESTLNGYQADAFPTASVTSAQAPRGPRWGSAPCTATSSVQAFAGVLKPLPARVHPCTPRIAEATGTSGSPSLGAPARPHLLLLLTTLLGMGLSTLPLHRQDCSCSAQGGCGCRSVQGSLAGACLPPSGPCPPGLPAGNGFPQGGIPASDALSLLHPPGLPSALFRCRRDLTGRGCCSPTSVRKGSSGLCHSP